TSFQHLPDEQRLFTSKTASLHRFTLQELRQFVEIALDLNRWNETNIIELWPNISANGKQGRERKKALLQQLTGKWLELKSTPNRYQESPAEPTPTKPVPVTISRDQIGLGYCPVASEKTRCCNLLTLDAVENCGFDCSYCSIQSFYHDNQVIFDTGFADKLAQLELDPEKTYHIGTGQSSDSLMWGNNYKLLDALIRFADANPNVILELKTKSANITHLSIVEIPPNIICTWSLNTETIIQNEEHATASLQRRLQAAREIADQGAVVGFHFHPIIHYAEWQEEYSNLYLLLQQMFEPTEVAMVSLGTLTFIKPVLKKIRERHFNSKILKMPMVEAAGKVSYPAETKLELFSHAYNSFSPQWHAQVFFYLCMEGHEMWQPVFGYHYRSNAEFEQEMKASYLHTIEQRMQHG
ncbi:MAG: DNA photolyase, partial [Gammaproteobacteria bacterium]|nr:DNA photolyase [Gammaproteobacteria bacterium]